MRSMDFAPCVRMLRGMRQVLLPGCVLSVLVACGGNVEPPPPCSTDAGFVVDASPDVVDDAATPDANAACKLVCDPQAPGWVCGGRILGCPDAGPCCDLQAPGCGCLGDLGYFCSGQPSDDATSCAKCGTRCNSTPDAGGE